MNGDVILIVTPTLADSPFLDATVQSIRAQSVPFIHLIAVPKDKMASVKLRYPHAIVVPDAGRAGGIYGALNAALDAAPSGWNWFTYINDDDLLSPAFSTVVRRHLAKAHPEPVAYAEVDLIDETGVIMAGITIERAPAWIPALLKSGISPMMQQGTLFARRLVEQIGRFDLRYRLCADLDFWLRCYAAGAKFRHHPDRVAQFRIRAGQLSSNTKQTMAEQEDIVARHIPFGISAFRRRCAVIRFRLLNLPKYLFRLRRHGLRSSYKILGGDDQKPFPAN